VVLTTIAPATVVAQQTSTSQSATAGVLQPAGSSNSDVGTSEVKLETVVVTGSRNVITPPREIKLKSKAIVDSITAGQLAGLPDMTLAQALDRVVGVSSDLGYNSSQPRTVTIRGFDARYNSMDVDGNPIWNASRNNRGTQLDVFPASVVSQIDVYKTILPDQDANSIGGHITLRTLRAFDGGSQPYLYVRSELGHYEQGEVGQKSTGPSFHFAGVGKNTFGPGDRYGYVVGLDAERDKWDDIYNQVTGYSQLNGVDVVNGSLLRGNFDHDVKRVAFYGKLEAHATNQLYAFLDADYFDEKNDEHDHQAGPFVTASTVQNASPDHGQFPATTSETFPQDYYLGRATVIIGSGLDYKVGSLAAVTFRAGYTNYEHKENLSVGERFESPFIMGSYSLSGTDPGVILNSIPGLDDPTDWIYRNKKVSYIVAFPDIDNVYSLRTDYNYNTFSGAEGFGFSAGLNWRELDRNFNETQWYYTLPKGTLLDLAQVIGADTQVNGVVPTIFNSEAFWNDLEANGQVAVNDEPTADYHLIEQVYAAYADMTYAKGGLHVLAGARVEHTHWSDVTGETQASGMTSPEKYYFDYTNPLPNVQAYYDFDNGVRIRAAYTQALARPDFSDFAMGQTVSLDSNGYPVISGTNHYLKPRESSNYDVSIEYYYTDGFGSLGAFYKDMRNEEFSEVTQTTNPAGNVILTESIPLNSGHATDEGVEANLVVNRFRFLPAPLDGFGLSANYTWIQGKWNVVLSNGSERTISALRNQPHWLANADLNYKLGPARIDVDWRFRGRAFTGTFGATPAQDIWIADYKRLDAQFSWHIADGFDGYLSGVNLNNAYWVQQEGVDNSLQSAISPGRSYWIGFKLKQ